MLHGVIFQFAVLLAVSESLETCTGKHNVICTNESPGTTLSYSVDTISTLNHDLLSLTEFYDERGYDVVLSHDGFSGLVKTLDDGTKMRIPVTYDPFSHRWVLHYVIASSSKVAERLQVNGLKEKCIVNPHLTCAVLHKHRWLTT